MQGLSRSIQRELNSFYQKLQTKEFSIQYVTKGAFSRARQKLKPEAFIQLNQIGIKSFYSKAPYLEWNGYRLLAVDGSTAVLPSHQSIIEEFGQTGFGPQGNSFRSVARMSFLYDVLNLTVLDAQVDRYDVSERALARRHFEHIDKGTDLVLFDRGYPSLSLMFEMQALGITYLIRVRDDFWNEAKQMLSTGEKDKAVVFDLPKKDRGLLEKYNTKDDQIKFRIVITDLPGGEKVTFFTSVMDEKRLDYKHLSELYHKRWNIEEGYKLFKCRVGIETFSGKTVLAVKQDFFAKVFMMTTTAVLAFPVEEKIKQEVEQSERKHAYKINRTNALAMTKEIISNIFNGKSIKQALQAFDKILTKTVEIVRPNRKFTRKTINKKPPSMNYKQL
jgi:hypothetical protein